MMNLVDTVRNTAYLRAFGLFKVPLIFFTRPTVVELGDRRAIVRIPFLRRNRNHLGSMYFGVLCTGADCAGGIMAMRAIERSGKDVSLIFKDFKAEFLKRAEGDVHFTCEDGEAVSAFVDKVVASGERMNMPVHVVATVPSRMGTEPVARFELTLSLKRR
jgi:acyl-coenzyme A thioesterase PaaI-like protein